MIRLTPRLPARVWWSAIKAVIAQNGESNIGLISAGVAFFAMLALFPAIGAVIAIWSLFSDPVVVNDQLELMREFIPAEAFDLIAQQVTRLVTAGTDTLGFATIVSILVAIWSTRAGVGAMIVGLNTIYGERNRGGLRHYIQAFLLTLALLGVALIALSTVVVAPIFLAFLPISSWATLALQAIRWAVAVAVVLAGIGMIYRWGPNRRAPRIGWITPGAVLAVLLWALASVGLSLYLSNFASYNEIYGTLGAVIALLFWLYLSTYLVLLGAALNAQLEKRTAPDSTIGRPRPRGQRGAKAADEYLQV